MKKVLVPMAIYQDTPIIGIHGARPTYIKKLIQNGLLPIFVSPLFTKAMIDECYEICSGMFSIGGEDWEPKLYGAKKHVKTLVGESERDDLELPLLKRALKDKKPFLGLCRGNQGLAIASGGSLIQHVPEIVLNENHNPNNNYDDLLQSNKHRIIFDKKSKAYQIMKVNTYMVNSYHHQAIENPGKYMRIAAESPEGIIEMIEHEDRSYFCFGIQCHPETEEKSKFDKIFAEFAKAIKYNS